MKMQINDTPPATADHLTALHPPQALMPTLSINGWFIDEESLLKVLSRTKAAAQHFSARNCPEDELGRFVPMPEDSRAFNGRTSRTGMEVIVGDRTFVLSSDTVTGSHERGVGGYRRAAVRLCSQDGKVLIESTEVAEYITDSDDSFDYECPTHRNIRYQSSDPLASELIEIIRSLPDRKGDLFTYTREEEGCVSRGKR